MNGWLIGNIVLSLVSPISYTQSMLRGQAKPHKVTRLIVWVASMTAIIGVIGSDNVSGIAFASIFFLRATYLMLMSLKYGVGGSSRLDKTCVALGLLAIVLYPLTGSGILSVLLGITADLIAFIPTFVKIWHDPSSEDPIFFAVECAAALCAVIAIGTIKTELFFPLYIVLCNVFILMLIFRKYFTPKGGKRASF